MYLNIGYQFLQYDSKYLMNIDIISVEDISRFNLVKKNNKLQERKIKITALKINIQISETRISLLFFSENKKL